MKGTNPKKVAREESKTIRNDKNSKGKGKGKAQSTRNNPRYNVDGE